MQDWIQCDGCCLQRSWQNVVVVERQSYVIHAHSDKEQAESVIWELVPKQKNVFMWWTGLHTCLDPTDS